jgi:hypothetical protein
MKKCSKCKTEKSADTDNFYQELRHSDRLSSWCISCVSTNNRLRYKNGGKIKSQLYKQDNASKIKMWRKSASLEVHTKYLQSKRIAKDRNLSFGLTEIEYARLAIEPCHYCSLPFTSTGSGLDRLDNSIGYTSANVVSCCPLCNQARSNKFTPIEMKKIGETIKLVLSSRMRVN